MAVARLLRPAPSSFLDAHTRRPAYGAYVGRLPPLGGLAGSLLDDVVRRKRWVWACLSAEDVFLAFAVVRTGYAASAFVSVFDTRGFRLRDRAWTGPSALGRVTDDVHAAGLVARFAAPRVCLELSRSREDGGLDVRLRSKSLGLEVDAVMLEAGAPVPLAVIADLGAGDLDATEKRALMPIRGHARIGDRRVMLDGGLGGYDYTQGFLPRRTRWRWAYGVGTTTRGELISWNLTAGFVGEAECAVFDRGGVHGVAEPVIAYDEARPDAPWSVRGSGVDLTFRVAGVHAERRRLGILRTDFLQPVGTFDGTVEVGGRVHVVRDLPGVVEDQDVLW